MSRSPSLGSSFRRRAAPGGARQGELLRSLLRRIVERTTWDRVLDDLAARIRAAIVEGRRNEVMYHVGRPGEDGYALRILQSWGVDGHNSHTNVCSSAARLASTSA